MSLYVGVTADPEIPCGMTVLTSSQHVARDCLRRLTRHVRTSSADGGTNMREHWRVLVGIAAGHRPRHLLSC